jgi:hypothetical protein
MASLTQQMRSAAYPPQRYWQRSAASIVQLLIQIDLVEWNRRVRCAVNLVDEGRYGEEDQ